VNNTYIFVTGYHVINTHQKIYNSTIVWQGQVDNNNVPTTRANSSMSNNDAPLSLRNTSATVKNFNFTHAYDFVGMSDYQNISVIRFVNCIICRHGIGALVALHEGGYVYFESFG
jgi:hypothetical protein